MKRYCPLEPTAPLTFSLGQYTLIEPIAQGGAGEVWRGRHTALGLDVAVKLVMSRHAGDDAMQRALRREISLVARLSHPAIVRVFDHGLVPSSLPVPVGAPYLVMELATEGTLIERPPPLSWNHIRRLIRALLDALSYSHARGIVHRDIKPGNVLVDARWPAGVKLSDFGIGARIAAESPVSGTPAYMAPEQSTGGIVGPWSDLYSLGCMVWQLTTGAPPFLGPNTATTVLAHRQPLPAFRPRFPVPKGLEAWLARLLAKSPRRRFRSAAVAAFSLQTLDEVSSQTTAVVLGEKMHPQTVAATVQVTQPWIADTPVPKERLDSAWLDEPQLPWVPDWRDASSFDPALRGAGLSLFGLREIPMIGREAQRDQLWRHLGEVTSEGCLRVVSILGEEGQGKTRLCRWLCDRASEMSLATPLWVEHLDVRGLGLWVERLMGGRDPKRALRALQIQYGDRIEPDVVSELCKPLLSMAPRRAMLVRLIEGVARVRPVVLIIDDATSQEEAVSLVLALRMLREIGVLVVVCGDVPTLAPIEHEVRLDPMTPHEVHRLIETWVGVEEGLTSAVQIRSRGNPGVVQAVIQHWIHQGHLEPSPSGFRVASGVEPTVPADLTAVWSKQLMGAMAGLPDHAWVGVEIAAVLGHHVDHEEWLDCGAGSHRGLDALVEARLLRPTKGGWEFAHPLVVFAILDHAERTGRLKAHHATCAARVHDPDRHAVHLFRAGEYEAALGALVVAIRAERRGCRGTVALLNLYDEALDALSVPDDDARRAHVLHRRINLALNLGNRFEAQRCIDELRARRTRPGWAAPATWALLAWAMLAPVSSPEQLKRLQAAWTEARGLPRGHLHINTERMLADAFNRLGRHVEADHWIQQALTIQPPSEDETVDPMTRLFVETWDAAKAPNVMSYAWRALADLRTQQRRPREAIEAAQRALEFPHQQLVAKSYARVQMGKAYRMLGDLPQAEAQFMKVLAIDRAFTGVWATMEMSYLQLIQGNLSEARRWLYGTERQVRRNPHFGATVLLVDAAIAAGLSDWSRYDQSIERAATVLNTLAFWDVDVPDLAIRARDFATAYPQRAAKAEALIRRTR